MANVCCMPNCSKRSWSNQTGISYHGFPKDPQLSQKWTNFVRYTNKKFRPAWHSSICSKHFTDSSFLETPYIDFLDRTYHLPSSQVRLHHYAVPTILYAYRAEDIAQPDRDQDEKPENTDDEADLGSDPEVYESENQSETQPSAAVEHRRDVLHFVRLTDINAYITCFLCGGYMYNATTIIECLHTFCRKCILQHFQKDNRCPTCDILIHESIPFSFIRQDGHLQTIINKLLPSFEQTEREGEKSHMAVEQKELSPTAGTAPLNPTAEVVPIYSKIISSAQVSLQLDYLGASSECPPITPLQKNFIRVSSQATIHHVQKFIAYKLKLSAQIEVDIICGEEILQPAVILYNLKREINKEQMIDNILVLSYSLGMSQ